MPSLMILMIQASSWMSSTSKNMSVPLGDSTIHPSFKSASMVSLNKRLIFWLLGGCFRYEKFMLIDKKVHKDKERHTWWMTTSRASECSGLCPRGFVFEKGPSLDVERKNSSICSLKYFSSLTISGCCYMKWSVNPFKLVYFSNVTCEEAIKSIQFSSMCCFSSFFISFESSTISLGIMGAAA